MGEDVGGMASATIESEFREPDGEKWGEYMARRSGVIKVTWNWARRTLRALGDDNLPSTRWMRSCFYPDRGIPSA